MEIPTGWAIVIPHVTRDAAETIARILLTEGFALHPQDLHLRQFHEDGSMGERIEVAQVQETLPAE